MVYYPYSWEEMNILEEPTVRLIEQTKPNLIIFGQSEYLFPHPIERPVKVAKELGIPVYYDGSHVLGLIAGNQFPNPFNAGVDVMTGSSHKTFSGPQGAMILVKDDEARFAQIKNTLTGMPMLQSCCHLARIVATAVALAEMREFGTAYAAQITKNAQAFAKALKNEGLLVLGVKHGYTSSHQVILDCGGYFSEQAQLYKELLERANIIADGIVRFGVQEVTRQGMKEGEMVEIARLVRRAVLDQESSAQVAEDAAELAKAFSTFQFCFGSAEEAYGVLVS